MMSVAMGVVLILLMASYAFAAFRFFRGPTLFDRMLAFEGIVVSSLVLLVLVSWRTHSAVWIDVMMIISLLGFITPLAFLDYIHNRSSDKEPLQ